MQRFGPYGQTVRIVGGFLVSQAEGDPDGGQGELCHLARFKPSRPVAGEDGRLGGPLSF